SLSAKITSAAAPAPATTRAIAKARRRRFFGVTRPVYIKVAVCSNIRPRFRRNRGPRFDHSLKGIAMKTMRFAVLGMAALFVAACLPVTTKNPVGTSAGFKQDPSIIGVWKVEPQKDDADNKQGFIAFLNASDEDAMTGILLAPGKDAGDWGSYN